MIEKDETVYLEDEIDGLFERYPNSFTNKTKTSLKTLPKNENRTDYNNLSFSGKFHKTNFLKKYGTFYSLLKDLLTNEMTLVNAIDAQINFINDPILSGYNELDFNKELLADLKRISLVVVLYQ